MANTWFRLHHEFATDPKVQSLTEAMQRRLVMMFCLESSGQLGRLSDDEMAFYLRIDVETLHETFQLFDEKGFTDKNGRIKNWEKRQFRSDNSTDRVKKYRDKTKTNKNETTMKRFSNADVTAPDTDTDSYTDTEKKEEVSKEPSSSTEQKISFDFSTREWSGITETDIQHWSSAFPACQIDRQLLAMGTWLYDNPKRRKTNYRRFINSWLSRAQDRGGDLQSNQPKGIQNGKQSWGQLSEKYNESRSADRLRDQTTSGGMCDTRHVQAPGRPAGDGEGLLPLSEPLHG